jgi:hypothetical protein
LTKCQNYAIMVYTIGIGLEESVYTFYFKQVAYKVKYKLVAIKGDTQPIEPELGAEYSIYGLHDLVDCGCQVIMIPAFPACSPISGVVDDKGVAPTMRYAKGYRGPQLGDKVDYANLSGYYLGFQPKLPQTHCQEDLAPAEYKICRATHPECYICTLAKGHSGQHEAWGTERIEKLWDNLVPSIGPLPPQAPLAPVQEMDAAPAGTMLDPRDWIGETQVRNPEQVQAVTDQFREWVQLQELMLPKFKNSTWWTRLKECFDWS